MASACKPRGRSVASSAMTSSLWRRVLAAALASLLAIKVRLAVAPEGITLRNFIGAACLCGIGDTVALLMADQAFPQSLDAAVAKIGVLLGSVLAAALGATVLAFDAKAREVTPAPAS